MATSQIMHAKEVLVSAWTLILGTERAIERSKTLLEQSQKLMQEQSLTGQHHETESATPANPQR